MKTLTAVLFSSFLIACGGGGGDDDDDDVVLPDADTNNPDARPTPDAMPVNCLATADYGAATLTNPLGQWKGGTAATPQFLVAAGLLNADTAPDALQVELYKGFGAFTAGEIVPGTYQLTGQELDYATCGVCVRVLTDLAGSPPMASDNGYFATSGTVTITQVSPNFAGSVSNIVLQHVNIDPNTFASTPHADGCGSALTSAAWDVTPTQAP